MDRSRTHLIFRPGTRQIWIGFEGESGGQSSGDQTTADNPAPTSDIPASSDAATTETPAGQTTPATEVPKTFTQEELDGIVGKRLAKERRKWERDQGGAQAQPNTPIPLTPDQFQNPADYASAYERQIQEEVNRREAGRQQAEVDSIFADREEDARERYDDYDQIARGNHPVTNEMALAIKTSDKGPDIAYWLGSNPKEASRIAALHPLQQAREIGKIEAKLASEPPVKKSTSAPAPITPVTTNRTPTSESYDTTDPRSIGTLSTSEWIAQEQVRVAKRLSR